jgi:hypothetical protein
VVSINTKHHRTGKLVLDGDELVLNGYRTGYVPKARREAQRVAEFLGAALASAGKRELAGRVPVRPLIVIVGGRLVVERSPSGVTVVMTSGLIEAVRAFPAALGAEEVPEFHPAAGGSSMTTVHDAKYRQPQWQAQLGVVCGMRSHPRSQVRPRRLLRRTRAVPRAVPVTDLRNLGKGRS